MVLVVAVVIAYVLSGVSFPYLIARAKGVDLGATGSRKLGGSNLMQSVGAWWGLTGGLLDAAKGIAAVLIARALGLPLETQLACGVAAVVGQAWPIFHGFDGGRANATGWGFALAADPVAALIMGVPLAFAVVARFVVRPHPRRLVPLASLLSFAVFPAVIWEQDGVTPSVVAGLIVLAVIVVRRLTAGLRADVRTGAPLVRIMTRRLLYDRSELQARGVVEV